MATSVDAPDWSTIPAPKDDGAAAHLFGMRVPSVPLPATDGTTVDLSSLRGTVVVYAYPRTGIPGIENPPGWDLIPGARGCTPQTCEFRDHHRDLTSLGAEVFGLSTQTTEYQREMVERLHVPFEVLSDCEFRLCEALRLPTFEADGMRLVKRLTLVIRDGVIETVFYPVFPPNESAGQVINWLTLNRL